MWAAALGQGPIWAAPQSWAVSWAASWACRIGEPKIGGSNQVVLGPKMGTAALGQGPIWAPQKLGCVSGLIMGVQN